MEMMMLTYAALAAPDTVVITNAVVTNSPVVIGPTAPIPVEIVNWLNLLITGLTPVVTLGLKKLVPRIPRVVLPLAAPIIGIGLDFVLRLASVETGGWLSAMIYGSLGTWLYQAQKEVRLVATEKELVPITPPALNVKGKDSPK